MKNTNANFQPVIIGTKTNELNDHKRRFDDKIRRFNTLYDYLSKVIPIKDKNTLKTNIYETFLTTFLAKHKANFPLNAPTNSILQFMQIDTNKITSLIDEFNAVNFDLTNVNLDAPVLPNIDFSIYTETPEQNELFFRINKVVTAIAGVESLGKIIYKAQLIQAFNFMLFYDIGTQKLSVNTNYILKKVR